MTDLHFLDQRDRAERHRCPYCQAAPGEQCRNSATGDPVRNQPAHLSRLRLADQEPTP
jgi:hypothetical protein